MDLGIVRIGRGLPSWTEEFEVGVRVLEIYILSWANILGAAGIILYGSRDARRCNMLITYQTYRAASSSKVP